MTDAREADPARPYPSKVTIVGTLPPLRAISSYCEGLAVAQAGHCDVEFFSFHALYPSFLYPGGALEDPHAAEPEADRLEIHRVLSWYNPFSWLAVGMRLRGQVLNLQWWSLPLAPVFITIATVGRLRRIPVVTTVHNVAPHGRGTLVYRLLSGLLYRLSDRLIVHSENNRQQLKSRFDHVDQKTIVSPMGMADFARGRPTDKQQSRERLGLPTDRRILLMFGAVRGYKGLPDALHAMVEISRERPETLLLVAGQAWDDAQRYRDIVNELGLADHVKLDLRYIPERQIHHYFSAADLLLLPYTRFSAQSGAGTSALSYGLPVVTSNCGSLPELVEDPASVIEPGDRRALASRVIAILGNPDLYEKLASETSAIGRTRSWNRISASLCAEYGKLVATEGE